MLNHAYILVHRQYRQFVPVFQYILNTFFVYFIPTSSSDSESDTSNTRFDAQDLPNTTESHCGCPLTSKVLQLLGCHPHFAPTHAYYPESIPFRNSL